MAKSLVIVESPTKAKTIEKYLGKGYKVTASYGHIRDLPNSAAEIPEDIKKEKWSRLGINVDEQFSPLYIVPEEKKKRVAELKKLLKDSDELLLATDEDREGESISWHLLEVLKPKVPVRRLVFNEITKAAIQHSIQNPRDVDESLVRAQETRRIVDRLFGYTVSPLLWKKMAPRLSAGRVQSVAMRLLVERERERIRFRSAQYWDLKAEFAKKDGSGIFEAELTHVGDKRVASGKDFEPTTGKLSDPGKVVLLGEKEALELKEKLQAASPNVLSVEEKPYTTKPYPPFTTSSLQQEASRKLRFAARHTMSVAQKLYENGYITYMRTDSTALSDEGLGAARTLIGSAFGKEYLSEQPRVYKTKVKNAQEAHEAIRPSGESFVDPEIVRKSLGMEPFKLYEMIWKRTLACQMKDAEGMRIGVQVECADAVFRASGKTITFPGFLRAYVEDSDDPEAELADREKILPQLSKGEALQTKKLDSLQHETQPPARYTEGSLIKELERLGIGRPSTWATIVGVVLNRSYAFKKGTALVPTFLASGVTNLMEGHFTQLMDYEFTARLEDDLDEIARGERDSLTYLNKFYFGNGHPGLKTLVEKGEEEIDPREVCGIPIGTTGDGRKIEVRIGRYGPFLSDGENRAGLPEGVAPDELSVEEADKLLEIARKGPESLGAHPQTGQPVYLKSGRFGPYVQLGDQEEGGDKPKMASLLPGMEPNQVDFETAVKLLEFPKVIGKHPENGEEITVANGRYGPYIKCGAETRSIPVDDISPLEITIPQCVELLKQPRRRGGASQPKQLKEVGVHPVTEKKLVLKAGRYGPYVTDGELNASLPKGADPDNLTLEEAVTLLAERAAKVGAKGGKKKASSKKKSATKKTASKKAASKKTTAKKKSSTKKTSAKKKTSTKKKASSKSAS
ncbi:MAG: type I DNA topoisomerase [Bdellovibrionales bacterium]|nr:type I DNA topoisomerase [Bdellovibrionales bacterium]